MKTRYLFGIPLATIIVNSYEIEAIVDTGFTGWLMLPYPLIHELGLENIGLTGYAQADGSLSEGEVFEAEVEWFGRVIKVSAVATGSGFPLLGMGLLADAKTVLRPAKNILVIEPDNAGR